MKIARLLPLCWLSMVLVQAGAAEPVVSAGAGSYAIQAPGGVRRPPEMIYRTDRVRGPMPTNDWWSSLAWNPLSDTMYPHPLAVRAVPGGLRVYYPGANITANAAAIFGFMAPQGGADLIIGHSEVERFAEARVDGFNDWFVSALFEDASRSLRTTFGHGSPFVFVELQGGDPTLTFAEAPTVFSGAAGSAVLGVSFKGRHYGFFAPAGSTWSGLEGLNWRAHCAGKGYFSVAVLPDAQPETLALFAQNAHRHVVDTRVKAVFDEKSATVRTAFQFTTKAFEGAGEGTLFALYPHQWTRSATPLLSKGYPSVRGEMKLGAGSGFTTEMLYPGVLPSLPLMPGQDKAALDSLIGSALAEKAPTVGDTYWLGKQLGKWATLLPIAEQTGNAAAQDALTGRLRTALENFFTATDSKGALKPASDGLFFHDANWGALIGYPASYDSDRDLNDHHFHYGYFIRAAGELARRDPAWASDARWGAMVRLLIRDIASGDRTDALFPYLRSFDPYAGHSWASGHARFADGNNNESSSEAMNAWYGMILFGAATHDRALRDLGIWLFTTEMEAINAYWFDVENRFRPKDYPASVVTMVWGGKGANGTWFTGNPEQVHGINWLPLTGASLYLGRFPEYVARNYAALVKENLAEEQKKAAKTSPSAPVPQTAPWDAWADIVWMYLALNDPKAALAQFESRAADFKPEAGNSLANVSHWLGALNALGEVDRGVSADAPFYAVFQKAGRRTHVAYNMENEPRTITFSDGVSVRCEPKRFGIK